MARRRFLFVSWWGGGNVLPVVALGRELLDRGHEVLVIGNEPLRPRLEAAGLPFEAAVDAAAAVQALAASPDRRPDAAVVDFMMPAVLSVLEAVPEVPTAALVHTLFAPVLDRFVDLVGAFTTVDALNQQRRALGLDHVVAAAELLDEARLDRVLVAFPAAVDAEPVTPLPAHVRHLGAISEPLPPGSSWAPPLDDDRPLVLVTLGTTPMGEEAVLQRVLDGLADADVRVVATAGDHVDRASLRVPENASVTGYVPHALALPHASVLVTHAGLGTVVAGLRAGVPLLCLPLGRDQPANAARVAALGAGRVLAPDVDGAEVAVAVRALVREDAPERAGARRAAEAVGAATAPGAAADAVEGLVSP